MAIVDATGKIDMALWDRLGQAEHWPCARCGLKAIAPLLRVALLYAGAYDSTMPDADCRALDTLRALTDELEAK